jgi:PAS domain S-box-containing protein
MPTKVDEYSDEINVIHIDDDESLLTLSKIMLNKIDPKIKITNISCPETLTSICKKYDLIITDYVMPKVNGIALAKKIREKCDVPIIIYTGKGSEEVAEEAFQAGIDDYIRKELESAHYQVFARRIRAAVEKDRSQKELVKSEEKYRNLFENMNEGVALHKILRDEKGEEVDYVLLDANPCFERLTGMDLEDVKGKLGSEIYGLENLYLEKFSEVARTGQSFFFNIYRPNIDKYFRVSLFPTGKDVVAEVFTDVTEQKRLIKELKSGEEMMRNVFRVSHHTLVVADTRGYVSDCNDAALKMFGFKSVDDVMGLNCFDFVSEKYVVEARENWVDRINSGTLKFYEYELKRASGARFLATVSGSVMRDTGGNPSGLVLSVEDITERRELKEYCVALNNAIEERFLDQAESHIHS